MDTHNQQPTTNNQLKAHWILIRFLRFSRFPSTDCTFWTKHSLPLFVMEITLVDGWCYCYFEALFTLAIPPHLKFKILNLNFSELLCLPFEHRSRFKYSNQQTETNDLKMDFRHSLCLSVVLSFHFFSCLIHSFAPTLYHSNNIIWNNLLYIFRRFSVWAFLMHIFRFDHGKMYASVLYSPIILMWNLKNNNEKPHFPTLFFHTFEDGLLKIMSSLSCCDKHIYRGVHGNLKYYSLPAASQIFNNSNNKKNA